MLEFPAFSDSDFGNFWNVRLCADGLIGLLCTLRRRHPIAGGVREWGEALGRLRRGFLALWWTTRHSCLQMYKAFVLAEYVAVFWYSPTGRMNGCVDGLTGGVWGVRSGWGGVSACVSVLMCQKYICRGGVSLIFLKVLRRADKTCYLDPFPPFPVFLCCVCFIKTHHLFLVLPSCLCVSSHADCFFVFVKECFVLESQRRRIDYVEESHPLPPFPFVYVCCLCFSWLVTCSYWRGTVSVWKWGEGGLAGYLDQPHPLFLSALYVCLQFRIYMCLGRNSLCCKGVSVAHGLSLGCVSGWSGL